MAVTWKKVITANAEEALAASTALSISGTTLTLTKGDASTDAVTTQDTNTTYSAGTNVTLSGTTFSSTDTNTTYSAGTNMSLSGTTFAATDTNTVDMGDGFPVTNILGGTEYTITEGVGFSFAAGTNSSIAFDSTNKRVTYSSTDTNTTYSAGTNVTLSGTTFSSTDTNTWTALSGTASGYVTTQGSSSTSVFLNGNGAWATPTNTTYSEATGSAEGLMSTAHHDKLDAIEASADVTDTTNVTSAGALMDSELAGIAAVKATTGTFLSADETKLDAIEASADVTDKTNVAAALALLTGSDTLSIGDSGNDATINIRGNMTVTGTTTTVNTETINLADNFIVLNSNETGTPSEAAGIEVERGTSDNAKMSWSETNDRWQIVQSLDTSFVGSVDVSASATAPSTEAAQGVGSIYMATTTPYIRVE